jgi:hypothetical protein
MFKYKFHWADGSGAGEAEYTVNIQRESSSGFAAAGRRASSMWPRWGRRTPRSATA